MSRKFDKEYNRMLSRYFSIEPSQLQGTRNTTFFFYRRYLYQLIYSRFEFENFPEMWDIDYFRDVLYQDGNIGVCDTVYGVLALQCGHTGINVYSKPTQLIFSNVVLGNFNRRIGKDCELIYFEYMNQGYASMNDIVTRYAVILSQCDGSLNSTLMNSRIASVFTSPKKGVLNSLKAMYDKVTAGEPAVFMLRTNENDSATLPYFNNVKNTYIGNDILDTKLRILNEFCTVIGIRNSNTQKKERLITDEANANNEMTYSLLQLWVDNLNRCFDNVREIFPEIRTRVYIKEIEVTDDELVSTFKNGRSNETA